MVGYYNRGAQEFHQQGLLTPYLIMNPGYPGHEDTPTTPNILFRNSAAASAPPSFNPVPLSHPAADPSPTTGDMQQFLGIPLLPAASTSDPNHDISSLLQAFTSNMNGRLWSSGMPPHQLQLRRQQEEGPSLGLSPHPWVPMATSSSAGGLSNGGSDLHRFWMESRYPKVAQQLLEEVVGVGSQVKGVWRAKESESKSRLRRTKEAGSGKINDKASELTTAERQDLVMKNVKLVNMLEEVEQRYKLYHHHIQTVVFSFEAAMGSGAGRAYTALALQTISKQFRCLKDAISSQIRGNAKCLGEGAGGSGEEKSSSGWRLRLIDHQLRPRNHNAWPQRGLPERSVSLLRAWLFQHFLHPYPKDSDKQLLAEQTGLTKSQVSNWFINARVRLWKPMVEEMYLEELKGSGIGDENSGKSNTANQHIIITIASPTEIDGTNHQTPAFTPPHSALPASDQEVYYRRSNPKRARSMESMRSNSTQHSMNMGFGVMGTDDDDDDDEREMMMKFGCRGLQNDEDRSHGHSLIMGRGISSGDAAFCAYSSSAEQLDGRFAEEFSTPCRVMNKSVSLTLGLPHGDNNLPLSRGHGQSLFSGIDRDQSIQQGRRAVELSSGSNHECCSGGLPVNKEPSCCSSLYL